MFWNIVFGIAMLSAIAGIPVYRLETIKYKQFYTQCYKDWNTAQELSELHICKNPSMRDRYRKYVKCDETKMGLVVTAEDCALGMWWDQFFLVRAFDSVQMTASDLYETLARTWYIYLLCALLCVVFVWSWVNARVRLQDRREERDHQHKLLTRMEMQFGYNGNEGGGGKYALQGRYNSRNKPLYLK